MFDRHQAEITVIQFTGHSLPAHQSMTVAWDFTLSHIVSQARLRGFLLITAIGMCHFLPMHHFGMVCLAGSKVNIQLIDLEGIKKDLLIADTETNYEWKISIFPNNPLEILQNYFVSIAIKYSHFYNPWNFIILRPTTGQVRHKAFFKVSPDAGPQPTRVQQNPKIPLAPSGGTICLFYQLFVVCFLASEAPPLETPPQQLVKQLVSYETASLYFFWYHLHLQISRIRWFFFVEETKTFEYEECCTHIILRFAKKCCSKQIRNCPWLVLIVLWKSMAQLVGASENTEIVSAEK